MNRLLSTILSLTALALFGIHYQDNPAPASVTIPSSTNIRDLPDECTCSTCKCVTCTCSTPIDIKPEATPPLDIQLPTIDIPVSPPEKTKEVQVKTQGGCANGQCSISAGPVRRVAQRQPVQRAKFQPFGGRFRR